MLWGGCQEGASPSYWPWIQILRAGVKEWGTDALHHALGSATADVAELVPEIRERLHRTRCRTVARSFYGQLTREGFTPEQVIALANQLLDMVVTDLEQPPTPAK